MASILVSVFGEQRPKVSAKLLEQHLAQSAINVDTRQGNLQAMGGNTFVSTHESLTPKTFWKAGSTWIIFKDDLSSSVVASPVQESYNRFIYTGDSYPKQSDTSLWSGTVRRFGVTPPAAIPTITHNKGTAGTDVQMYVSYVYTMVTSWGEESAPSTATAVDTIMTGEGITLGNLATPSDSGNNYSYKRIYRLESGTSGAEYHFLAQIAVGTNSYEDWNSTDECLNTCDDDFLATEDWSLPPNGLSGLTQGYNGMMLGFYSKELYVSEPSVPYAWPSQFQIAFESAITGVGAGPEFILVVTSKYPWIITGSEPRTLFPTRIPIISKCVSQRGVVSCNRGIFYPSEDGLCHCDGATVNVITKDWITTEQWAALEALGDIIGVWFNEKYYAFFEGTNDGIIIDVDKKQYSSFTLASPIVNLRDIYHDATSDTVYILSYDGSADSDIYSFNTSATPVSYTWKSKKFQDNNMYTCCQIRGSFTGENTVTFKYYLNGTLKLTRAAIAADTFIRLPVNPTGKYAEFEITGTATIDSVQLATDPTEII